MIICLCCSLDFAPQVMVISDSLQERGHTAWLPPTVELIRKGVVTTDEIIYEKTSGAIVERTIRQNSIRDAFERIRLADAILVLNFTKDGIENYIGGNTFLEIGFAHVLGKRIFLLNPVPNVRYNQEIMAMEPVILFGELAAVGQSN